MSVYTFIDNLQKRVDKQYANRQSNKDKYLKRRAKLFVMYTNSEITMDEMNAKKEALAKRYLNG